MLVELSLLLGRLVLLFGLLLGLLRFLLPKLFLQLGFLLVLVVRQAHRSCSGYGCCGIDPPGVEQREHGDGRRPGENDVALLVICDVD